MSIRTKIGIILLCAVICFCAAEYAVQRFVFLPGFFALEHDEAVKDAKRVTKAINNEIRHLSTLAWDWAAWDDTYEFVKSPSGEYIESNLVLSTFTGNQLNLIYICDGSGRVVWGKKYDLIKEKEIELDLFPGDALPATHPLLADKEETDQPVNEIKGILLTNAGPLIVAAIPILKSNMNGPSRGTFIMGRFMRPDLVRQIAEQTQVDFSLMPMDASAPRQELEDNLSSPLAYAVEAVDEDLLKVRFVLPDITGKPAIALTTQSYRKISKKGHETVQIGILSMLVAGMGILLLVLLSLKKTILQPISMLNQQVLAIRETGDLSKKVTLDRNDEIGMLAKAFDRMVSRIERITRDNIEINKQLRRDNEKRKQAEAALAESEKRFRALIEQAGDAVFLYDTDGNFRLVNPAACECLGYAKNQLLALSVYDVDPDAARRAYPYCLWENINDNQPVVFETRHLRKDDSYVPVEISLTAIKYSGEQFILAISRDIAQRKQADEKIHQARKMEALTTLTAGIAHNFNNILTVIIGCAELSSARLPKDNPAANLLKKIEDAGSRAKEIVWQLIRFSQRQENNFKLVQVDSVIEKEIRSAESVTAGKIKLISQWQPDSYPVIGDSDQIGDLIKNLLANAVESIKKDSGVVEVQLDNIADPSAAGIGNASLKKGKYIRLTVRDNGRGIEPFHMERIFDPYFTTKDFSKGAGMGLAVVRGLVINHGGAITVNSKVGKGTEIIIFLPAAESTG